MFETLYLQQTFTNCYNEDQNHMYSFLWLNCLKLLSNTHFAMLFNSTSCNIFIYNFKWQSIINFDNKKEKLNGNSNAISAIKLMMPINKNLFSWAEGFFLRE